MIIALIKVPAADFQNAKALKSKQTYKTAAVEVKMTMTATSF